MITITFSDGSELSNLTINGDNFISSTRITEDVFINKMSPVLINIDGNIEEHEHMDLVQITKMGSEYWFVLRDLTPFELAQLKLRSDVDFIAMMSDIDLDEI